MKQVIPFIKDISFNTRITEITSIALEHNLQMENGDSIIGIFTVSGKYKMNEVSVNEESFEKEISFDITLDDKYDASKVKIDIDDFYYEVINEELLRVHINVLIDNLIYVKKEQRAPQTTEIEEQHIQISEDEEQIIEEKKQIIEEINIPLVNLKNDQIIERKEDIVEISDEGDDVRASINANFLETTEQYVTYKVHIVRENDTIESIMEKYGVSKDDLQEYNAIDNITIGNKIIVPINNE